MIEYIPVIWLLFALLIPIALLIIGIKNLKKNNKWGEGFIKLFIAFLLYLPITAFGTVYIASLLNSIEHAKGTIVNGVRGFPTLDSTTFSLFLGYVVIGLILCWFVSKDLSEVLSFITGSKQTKHSIFDEK